MKFSIKVKTIGIIVKTKLFAKHILILKKLDNDGNESCLDHKYFFYY